MGEGVDVAGSQIELDRVQQRQLARFERMGLAVRPMPDGRSLLVTLPLGPAPFESVGSPLVIERIVFSTVGPDRIKCLRPRPVFGLPLLAIRHCADSAAIEAKIRQAWRERTQELRATGRALQRLGIEVGAVEGGSVLEFPLSPKTPDVRVLMQRLGEAILPGYGPLGGITLDAPDDRLLEVSDGLDSADHLDSAIELRIRQLQTQHPSHAENVKRVERVERVQAPVPRVAQTKPTRDPIPEVDRIDRRPAKVLLVGRKIIEDAVLREELTRNGYLAATARSEPEALIRLAGMTPDLVISEYSLGRSDGATLVQTMLALPGIERLPIVLIDDIHHASRRETASAVGAAAYLSNPRETNNFVAQLRRLVSAPSKRRYTRYPQSLAAYLEGAANVCVAVEVGRGGVFVATEQPAARHSAMNCELELPELDRMLRFNAEVLYANESQSRRHRGLGLGFREWSAEDEAALIEYLGWLESSR